MRQSIYRLTFKIVVPIRVNMIETKRAKFSRSFKTTTPMTTANTILVSRKAETIAIGANVKAQITSQDDP